MPINHWTPILRGKETGLLNAGCPHRRAAWVLQSHEMYARDVRALVLMGHRGCLLYTRPNRTFMICAPFCMQVLLHKVYLTEKGDGITLCRYLCHWIVHLKIVKMANFALCTFCHNFKIREKRKVVLVMALRMDGVEKRGWGPADAQLCPAVGRRWEPRDWNTGEEKGGDGDGEGERVKNTQGESHSLRKHRQWTGFWSSPALEGQRGGQGESPKKWLSSIKPWPEPDAWAAGVYWEAIPKIPAAAVLPSSYVTGYIPGS